jgi:hypothetical protein
LNLQQKTVCEAGPPGMPQSAVIPGWPGTSRYGNAGWLAGTGMARQN